MTKIEQLTQEAELLTETQIGDLIELHGTCGSALPTTVRQPRCMHRSIVGLRS